jgi:RimJ/RimL family protein N-acetyltransferase
MSNYDENAAVIRVENLLFRKPCLDDVNDLLAVKNDNEAAMLLGGVHHQYTEEDITNWINFHNSQEDEAVFVVVDTDTGHVIGHAGIYKIDKRIRRAEYGILIGAKNSRGKGYGTKITNTISEYGFSVLGLHKIKALVLKENLPSYYMFKKCGYVEEGVLVDENYKNDRYYDVVILSKFEK